MSQHSDRPKPASKPTAQKPAYRKPSIQTESLTAVAAVCNGVSGGGRKATTISPGFCSASKLKS